MSSDARQVKTAEILDGLLDSVPGLRGALVASVDGRAVAARLDDLDPSSTAAIVASSCALGERLADLAGEGGMEEIVVRAVDGYVVIYSVADWAVLTVLTRPSANLARLHLAARDVLPHLAELRQA